MIENKLTTIYVVRHGESGFNATDNIEEFKFDGEFGSPLTDNGKSQAEQLATKLGHVDFAAIFSSDLTRAKQTAEIVALEKNLAVEANSAIRERSIHEYLHKKGNLSADGVKQLNEKMQSDLKDLDEKGRMQYKETPNMESAEEGAIRLLTFIREAALVYAGKIIMIVCHGNLMRSTLTHLGYAKFDELPNGAIDNTGYFILESDGVDFFIKEANRVNVQKEKTRTF